MSSFESMPSRCAWSSLRCAVSRSATRRELTKQMVERCWSTRSSTRSSMKGQMDWDGLSSSSVAGRRSSVMSSSGTCTDRSQRLADSGRTMTTGRSPPRKEATRSAGRTVADSPIRCIPPRVFRASRRSRLSARCAPRLVPASACTSSMITVCTSSSVSPTWLESIRKSDSGVVIKMSGGWLRSRRRSAAGVSPERTATCT